MEKATGAEQKRKIKQNPFVTSDAALGEDFFGRKEEIEEVLKFIDKKKERNLLVYGQRRIGKTSLLLKIKEMVSKTGIGKAVFFDLQNKAKYELSRLLYEIAVQIRADVDAKIKFSKNSFAAEDAENYFKDIFLPRVFEKLPGDCLLIMLFDEFDTLGELEGIKGDPKVTNIAYHRFIPYLEGLKNKNFPIKFIFAVGRNYRDLDENRFGQVMKSGSKIEISYFEKGELESLIKASQDILPFDQDAVKRLYELTSGHPFFSQCLAIAAFDETVKSGQKIITPPIIEKQFECAIKSYGGGVRWLWESFSANDKIILYLMALIKEKSKTINDREIRAEAGRQNLLPAIQALDKVIEKLIAIKIIKKRAAPAAQEGPGPFKSESHDERDCFFCTLFRGIKKRSNAEHSQYDFYVEFFRKWIVMEFSIEEIGTLLKKIDPQQAYRLNPIGTKDKYLYIPNKKSSYLEKEGKDKKEIIQEIQRIKLDNKIQNDLPDKFINRQDNLLAIVFKILSIMSILAIIVKMVQVILKWISLSSLRGS